MKTGYSENRITKMLRKQRQGISVKEICKKEGVSDATFYVWKNKLNKEFQPKKVKEPSIALNDYNIMEYEDEIIDLKKKNTELENENKQLKEMFIEISIKNRNLDK